MFDRKLKVYLSGPMEYAHDGGASWRTVAEGHLLDSGFEVFNPIKSSNELLNLNGFKDLTSFASYKNTINDDLENFNFFKITCEQFVNLDVTELRTSDIVLAQVSSAYSAGTAGEITLAYFLNIPIILFSSDIPISEVSSWLIGCADEFCFSLSDAIKKIERKRAFLINPRNL